MKLGYVQYVIPMQNANGGVDHLMVMQRHLSAEECAMVMQYGKRVDPREVLNKAQMEIDAAQRPDPREG